MNSKIKSRFDYSLKGHASKMLLAVSSVVGDKVFDLAGKQLGKVVDVVMNIADNKIESIVLQFSALVDPTRSFCKVAFNKLSTHPANAFIVNELATCCRIVEGAKMTGSNLYKSFKSSTNLVRLSAGWGY